MKLYYSPAACSMAVHIILEELGLPFSKVKVDLKTKKTTQGEDFKLINPKGYVPAIETDKGELITEIAAIVQYICDLKPEKELIPRWGTMERYRAQEWLHYLSTEVHKLFTPLFFTDAWITVPEAKAPFREVVQQMLSQKCHYLANHLHKQPYLMGSQFSAPDAYLYTILNWSHYVKFDLTKWPALMGYMERLKNRPSVISTMEHEGLKRS